MANGKCSTFPSRRTISIREGATSAASRAHRAPGVGGELAAPDHDHDQGRRDEQHPGAHEPAEIAECKEEGALAAVEMTAAGFEHAGGADHMGFRFGRI